MIEDAPIVDFRGPHRWLSNFHLAEVYFEGNFYRSSEHAYQAAKANAGRSALFPMPTQAGLDRCNATRALFREPQPTGEFDADGNEILRILSCPEAKRLGGRIAIRWDWEDARLDVMETILHDKFTRHADLRALLLDTQDRELVEGNTWNDRFWGVCGGIGENHLGRLLMKIRAELRVGTEVTTSARPARRS